MVQIVICYIVFLVFGFIGGLLCPYDSKITGYANDYIGGGFVYSYRHDHDPIELLLFISVPIIIVAIIILIVKTNLDIKNAPQKEEITKKDTLENIEKKVERSQMQMIGAVCFFILVSFVSIGVLDELEPTLCVFILCMIGAIGYFIRYLFYSKKYDMLKNKKDENEHG